MNRAIKGRRVVVTGGAGFIGSHLVDRLLLEDPAKILVVDDLSLGKRSNMELVTTKSEVAVEIADAADLKTMTGLLERETYHIVFNLAVVPLPASLTQPMEFIKTKLAITTTLCELQRTGHFETLVQFSSSEVYGSARYTPMDERHPLEPETPYAASKVACDMVTLSYHRTFDLDISIVRPFNNYGPRQN